VSHKKNAGELLQEPSGRDRNNLIHKYNHINSGGVNGNLVHNPPRPRKSFQLLRLVLHRENGDEIVYHPLCNRCGYAVLDLTMANISAWDRDDSRRTPLGWQEETGCHVSLTNDEIYCFHKECDNSLSGSGWTNADNVFKSDQRFEFQKRWETAAHDGARNE
jgi:hypothetical protein